MDFNKEEYFETELRKVRAEIPNHANNPETLLHAADLASKANKKVEALVYSKKALDLAKQQDPNIIPYQLKYAECLSNASQYQLALIPLLDIVQTLETEKHPPKQFLIRAHYLLGIAYHRFDDPHSAEKHFNLCFELFGTQLETSVYDLNFYNEALNFFILNEMHSCLSNLQSNFLRNTSDKPTPKKLKELQSVFELNLEAGCLEFIFNNSDLLIEKYTTLGSRPDPWLSSFLSEVSSTIQAISNLIEKAKRTAQLAQLLEEIPS